MKSRSTIRSILLLPLAAFLLIACQPKSPEEKVAELRSYYKARLIGIIVEATPEATDPMADAMEEPGQETPSEDPMGELEGGEDGDVEGLTEEMPAPVSQNVLLDILVQHDSPEKLPGITLDIEMVDSNQVSKNSWKLWVDTSTLPKATGTQFTHRLESIDYVEGDGFNVEVRSPVPAEERGDYQEFPAP